MAFIDKFYTTIIHLEFQVFWPKYPIVLPFFQAFFQGWQFHPIFVALTLFI